MSYLDLLVFSLQLLELAFELELDRSLTRLQMLQLTGFFKNLLQFVNLQLCLVTKLIELADQMINAT